MTSPDPADEPQTPPLRPVLTVWLAACVLLVGGSLAASALSRSRSLSEMFVAEQDLPVAALVCALLVALRFAPLQRAPGWVVGALQPRRAGLWAAGTAGLVLAVGWAGAWVVMGRYGLSMDEFMAGFDADVLRRGRLLADVPPAWRAFVPALQPIFRLPVLGGQAWASSYLPVNAGLLALADALGDRALASPVMAAIGVLATWGVARRLWPERPDVAWVAAVLLASSSQLLVAAMTPYAMSGHLALNMTWLWLVLGRSRGSQAAAVVVAFLACGLHQILFHPMFAAPFVLWLWLRGRRRTALLHAGAYALILAFWTEYARLALASAHASMQGAAGAGYFVAVVTQLLADVSPAGLGKMSENLLRLLTWQNPLTIPLALVGVAGVRRRPGLWPFAAGIGLTLAVLGVLMPYQGHGWGYRYLHGLLGSLALPAAWGWATLTTGLDAPGRRGAAAAFALCAATSILLLLPVRAWQAWTMTAPYARAERAIAATRSAIVVIDPRGLLYGDDLVRNDPWLTRGPKVVDLRLLTPASVSALCRLGAVRVFDRDGPGAAGLRRIGPDPRAAAMGEARAALLRPPCLAPTSAR